jgi:DNA adenine methylase
MYGKRKMIMKNKKALIRYAGAKWRLADWIISYFPEHKSYLEPFFGSGLYYSQKNVPI